MNKELIVELGPRNIDIFPEEYIIFNGKKTITETLEKLGMKKNNNLFYK